MTSLAALSRTAVTTSGRSISRLSRGTLRHHQHMRWTLGPTETPVAASVIAKGWCSKLMRLARVCIEASQRRDLDECWASEEFGPRESHPDWIAATLLNNFSILCRCINTNI